MPDVAFDPQKAFYPYGIDENGKFRPSYASRICVSTILGICTKWEMKLVFIDEEWLYLNDFGACKRPRPSL